MKGQTRKRLVGAALLVALLPWCVGCATEIRLRQTLGGEEASDGGRLQVRVFETLSDRDRDVVTDKDVATELYRVDGAAETLVRQQREPRWSIADLAPGSYVLRAVRCVGEGGVVQTSFGPADASFLIRIRETTFADVVLKGPKHGWLVVLGVIVLTYGAVEDVKDPLHLENIKW